MFRRGYILYAGFHFFREHFLQLLEDRIALQLRIEAICRVRSRMPELLRRHLYRPFVARLDHLRACGAKFLELELRPFPFNSDSCSEVLRDSILRSLLVGKELAE